VAARCVARHALAALATAEAAVEQLREGRWVSCRDALAHGATLDEVAAAAGLDVDALIAGMTEWAARQYEHGLMDAAAHAEVLTLLLGGAR
jgi:hypothetical protein